MILWEAGHSNALVSRVPLDATIEGLPYFLRPNAKVTMDHDGAFHKGCIHYLSEGGFKFIDCRNSQSRTIDWSVLLPNFKQTWSTLLGDDIIVPGHSTVSSFLCSNTPNNVPRASFFSTKNLLSTCPPSLTKALHPTNPDHQVWLDSCNEEKQSRGAIAWTFI